MAESESPISQEEVSSQHHSNSEEQCKADGSSTAPEPETKGLSAAQQDVLERCLHALTHAKNDSHILAALLLITRLCPANQLDRETLHRVFEAVGFNLPARLLVTAIRGSEGSGLPPEELLSLGTALLAALSTDLDMATHPQLLSTIPLLLGLLENGIADSQKQTQHNSASQTNNSEESCPNGNSTSCDTDTEHNTGEDVPESSLGEGVDGVQPPASKLDEALAADCYQVLSTVCSLPRGPDQLLSRGAVPALCRAVLKKQTLSHEKGLPLLAHLLSSNIRERVWSKHQSELLSLLATISQNFSQAPNQDRLDLCSSVPQFLPPPTAEPLTKELQDSVSSLWASLRPLVQGKLSIDHLGPVLVLSACLLDLCGWEPTGSPKFCCLLVNRACVEVRMLLEEPPGTQLSAQQQNTLTACYRIMEAAMEQACTQGSNPSPAQPETAIAGLSLQQSRQVLGVLEEAFSAVIYYLQQVDSSSYDDPFLFATFRSLCAWLAEETSCLKEEVIALLPFLIGYAKHHLQKGKDKGLADWMSKLSVSDGSQMGTWSGENALRYLLPALCHLSAEEGPRKVLLSLDTPALLVHFLNRGWEVLRTQSGKTVKRDPSLETACSSLLNFAVTEPDRVRTDSCFASLEAMLSEALPVLIHKTRLLVLAANCCILGLMIGRLKSASKGPVESGSGPRRFFSCALRFLLGALQPGEKGGQARLSPVWEPYWDEVSELWRLGLQALGGCVNAQPWITALAREDGWLQNTLSLLESSSSLPDPHSQHALEEALCAFAHQCPLCRQDIRKSTKRDGRSSLHGMMQLRKELKD
ncbi:neurochondrin [Astyanax mexicanus]|uniref:Neurochondrin n=1 Tax=Astyanax mexicanus TaxID=7994 RepID=A0A8B9LHU4_ASTMX|nr:neurochondrin [Astyanax mexicanus]